jgi:hypothetical protein
MYVTVSSASTAVLRIALNNDTAQPEFANLVSLRDGTSFYLFGLLSFFGHF